MLVFEIFGVVFIVLATTKGIITYKKNRSLELYKKYCGGNDESSF